MGAPLGHHRRPLGNDRGRKERAEAEADRRAEGRADCHPFGGSNCGPCGHDRCHPGRGAGNPGREEIDLPAPTLAGGAPGGEVLAVFHHRAVAVAADERQGPRGDLVGGMEGGRIGDHADQRAGGKLPPARPGDAAAVEDPLRIIGAGVNDRAVAQIDAVVGVGDRRAGEPALHRESVAPCHPLLPRDLPSGRSRPTGVFHSAPQIWGSLRRRPRRGSEGASAGRAECFGRPGTRC